MSANETSTRPPLDVLTVFAWIFYVVVGGALVFAFGRMLPGAWEVQKDEPCASMAGTPKQLGHAPLVLQTLEGEPFSLDALRGKFLVVNFWATYCEPCISEWPQLHRLAERLANSANIEVLAISIDTSREPIAPFLARLGLSESRVRVLWSPEANAHQSWGSTRIPDTYFVQQDGTVVTLFENVREWGSAQALRCVEAAAAAGG